MNDILEKKNALMKEYKKKRRKNRKAWKKAFDSNNHQEVNKILDECTELDREFNYCFNVLDEQEKEKSIKINIIFSYDDKDQDMIDLTMTEDFFKYHLASEVNLVQWVIERSFQKMSDAHCLYKISMCVSPKDMAEKDFLKFKGIQEFLARGGKYYFQPNQRDKVESAIIKGVHPVAQFTKPFDIPKKLKSHIKLN